MINSSSVLASSDLTESEGSDSWWQRQLAGLPLDYTADLGDDAEEESTEEEHKGEAVRFLKMDIIELKALDRAAIAAINDLVVMELFRTSCSKAIPLANFPIDKRRFFIGMAESKDDSSERIYLPYEEWADFVSYQPNCTEEEVRYSYKAAKQGHEESKDFLLDVVRGEAIGENYQNVLIRELAKQLLKEGQFATDSDIEGDDGEE